MPVWPEARNLSPWLSRKTRCFSAPTRRRASSRSKWAIPAQCAFTDGEKDGSTSCEIEKIQPFVWADGDVADLGLSNAEKLSGDLRYNWLVTTDSWKELIALRNGLKKAGRSFFALSDPVQHYLTHTGRTLFKQLPL